MVEVNHSEMKGILKIAYKTKVPYFITGTIGIGKSESIFELANELSKKENRTFVDWNRLTKKEKLDVIDDIEKYFLFIDQRASQFDLGDFKLPQLDSKATDNGYFEWRIPLVYYAICKSKAKGILFFDEFSLSASSVQAMFYQIVNDRCIGEHKISDGIFIVGASNPSSDVSYVNEMGNALKDRFEHLELKIPNIEEFTQYCMEHDVDPRIIGFLTFRSSYIHKIPDDSEDENAFPTPRGWTARLSKMLKDIPTEKIELIEKITASNVGVGVAMEFSAFIKLAQTVDIDAILKEPKRIINEINNSSVKEQDKIGLKYSVLSALADRFRVNNSLIDKICETGSELEKDFEIMLVRMCKSADPKGFSKIQVDTKYKKLDEFLYNSHNYLK